MLPSGTVTLLFTDIQGSTVRWESDSDRMRLALKDHNQILEKIVAEHAGCVFKTVGDAYCVAFSRAEDAAAAALAAQVTLARAKDPLSVRMALHTASIQPTGDDYFGPPLNRVARLLGVASGGQILMSDATKALLAGSHAVKDLGSHALRDLMEPIRIWQLGAGEFPSIRGIAAVPNNLPLQTTSFVGREEEMRQIEGLLEKSRLITLTGTGGTGKTRLALQFAAECVDRFPDGVWLCELAALPEREDVLRALVTAVGAPDVIGTLHDRLVMYLAGKKSLVILDNCEHVLDAAAHVAEEVITSCAAVTLLVTSREPLGIRGEIAFRVPSLPAPDPVRHLSLEDLERYGSTALFLERLSAAAPAHELKEAEAMTIGHICHRLDGIPLAIELAAARSRAMSLDQIEKRLDDRFRLLTGGTRNALSRQQTLRALIDWSVQLLSERERKFLVALSVFGGGWDLGAAEEICTGEATGVEGWEVLDLLTALVDKSLVVFEQSRDRYRMLESIRQYALERLEQEPEALTLRNCHADHYLQIAEGFRSGHDTASFIQALARFTTDYENFRMAVEWIAGTEGGLGRAILALTNTQSGFHSLGRPGEFIRLMEPFLDRPEANDFPEVAGEGRVMLTVMRVIAGDPRGLDESMVAMQDLESFAPGLRSRWRVAISYALFCSGRFAEGLEFVTKILADETVDISSQWYPYLYVQRGLNLAGLGRFEESHAPNIRALKEFRRLGDERGYVACLSNVVMVHLELGRVREAVTESLEHNRLSTGAGVYLGSRSSTLLAFGHLALEIKDPGTAAAFYGGAVGMREASGVAGDPLDRMAEETLKRRLDESLAEPEFDRWAKKGKLLDWEPWFTALVALTIADVYSPEPSIPHRELLS